MSAIQGRRLIGNQVFFSHARRLLASLSYQAFAVEQLELPHGPFDLLVILCHFSANVSIDELSLVTVFTRVNLVFDRMNQGFIPNSGMLGEAAQANHWLGTVQLSC